MGSRHTALVHLEEELPAALAWGERHSVPVEVILEDLEVRAIIAQPETDERFFLRGRFDEYRELAPSWAFSDETWTAVTTANLFPRAVAGPNGATVLHSNRVICAPFNRLAYAQHGGPHGDWGGPASWQTAGDVTQVKADTLGDMLSVIYQHCRLSRGRLG